CADLQANGSPVFENITMYVTDADGNQDFCTTRLKVDDNDGVCGDDGTNTIVGKVTTYAPVEGIKDVVISYGNTPMYVTEGATGEYHFKTYNTNEQKLAGSHDKDYLNGVNVGDIIKIQNHILGKTQLDQPYKMLAADVNMDGSVKVSDIVEIRKLILGKIEKYNVGQSWRTFDSKYDLNMSNWAQTPDYVMVTPNQGQTTVNLNGVKLGDVDLNAKANFGSGAIEQRTVGTLSFRADDVVLNAGQTIEVPVKAKDFNNISGYQFTFAFDQSAIEFAGMKAGALNITAENYNADRASEGIVTTAVNVDAPMTVSNDEVLFTMVFNAKAETSLSKVLSVNSALTPAMGV
nr:cohesin domain-containing protein [Chitinophagales bacterium]